MVDNFSWGEFNLVESAEKFKRFLRVGAVVLGHQFFYTALFKSKTCEARFDA